ncbi:MAG: 2-oxoglutarate dehydrogenase E1 component [Desulfatitalea sp.]|nr:2-oxoglutarate dehydrogenase E1 component [Desulfatitalea sp.]NNJ99080.1 2-oxoglutarate dehydrogenase E1 component [Desulfatitalea sp.]
MQIPESLNLEYLDEQYQRYKNDPQSVGREWRVFFYGFDIGQQIGAQGTSDASTTVSDTCVDPTDGQVGELIQRYRHLGHLLACMDPLSECPTEHPLLTLAAFGLNAGHLEQIYATPQFSFKTQASLKQIVQILKATYCRSVGVEYMHLQDPDEREWLQARMEPVGNQPALKPDERYRILEKLTEAAMFEQFLNKRYLAVTRFSLEGGDAIIPMLAFLMRRLLRLGCREVILGMAHRGRLNVQANILHRPVDEILAEFENCYDSSQLVGAGDVKYHNGFLGQVDLGTDGVIQALLVNNPSHLEAVGPVVQGISRARQSQLGDQGFRKVVPLLLHGDAAFAGQGVVAETLNMSQLKGYATGGTLHVVINNQIGYTTLPDDARSTRYSTDLAKMLMVPIFHVHGENPEALIHVIRLAAEYRYAFHKDVVVDVVCYRRFGHNEGDEPYFTQPLMYDRIQNRPSLHKLYADELAAADVVTAKTAAELEGEATRRLEVAYDEVRSGACPFPEVRFFKAWERFTGKYSHEPVDTAVSREPLIALARQLNRLPQGFVPHSKIKLLLRRRLEALEKGVGIDWANAEALAFASLLTDGVPIRLSGQDSGRGTFSQRHSMLIDRKTGAARVPLHHLKEAKARFEVFDSPLSEVSVMGFDYGYALAQPLGLTLWEAQFGDFANNAQAIIDLFIASAETKWRRLCGLVLLLPHGWEGLGPEHSSARLERFLQLCADDNMQVCDLTTPAQYFHLLRRQIKVRYRKPLILMTPKSLLRHPRAVSTLAELSEGTFQAVLDDPAQPEKATRLLLCSGKIYYQLLQRREELQTSRIAIIRLEQYYPFPHKQIEAVLKRYVQAEQWVWVQEAPENMGGWQFVRPHLEAVIGRPVALIGRKASATTATGFPSVYRLEQAAIIDQAVGPYDKSGGIAS